MVEAFKNKKILIGPSSFAQLDKTPLDLLKEAGYETVNNPYKRKLSKKELMDLLSDDVVGLLSGLEPLDREVLQNSRLRVISRVGSGLSNVDMVVTKELGIEVFCTPDGPTNAVAELTIGVMIGLVRMVHQMDRSLHHGEWNKKIGLQLEDKIVAIVGFGRIGRRVAELLAPFRVQIAAIDPDLRDMGNLSGVNRFSLDEALSKADILSLHCSGETCIINDREFDLMKTGVYIINAARGNLISEKALIKALDAGKVSGAWLDVFQEEPYTGPLSQYENVILTPHIGSYTYECRRRMETQAVENLLNHLRQHDRE